MTDITTPASTTATEDAETVIARLIHANAEVEAANEVTTMTPPAQATLSLAGAQHDVPAEVDPLLTQILSWPRKDGSPAELMFRGWLTEKLAATKTKPSVRVLANGCRYVVIRHEDGREPTTLFSCHIDTVDAHADCMTFMKDGTMTFKRKELTYDVNFGLVGLARVLKGQTEHYKGYMSADFGCLGADDGVGVWIMMNMIDAGVPGGYLFHTGEECGGVGASAVLQSSEGKDILKKYEVAVAFDRPRDNEIITHQGGARTASDKFADALALALNKHGFAYAKSDRGVFTDTKIYAGTIAECTNIGVGYTSQHAASEDLDYAHAFALMKACCAINWTALPVDRDPAMQTDDWRSRKTRYTDDGFGYGYGGAFGVSDENALPFRSTYGQPKAGKGKGKGKKTPALTAVPKAKSKVETQDIIDELLMCSSTEIADWCESDPDQAANTMALLLLEIGRLRSDRDTLATFAGVKLN